MPAGDSAKADQIAFHIYTKLFHVVHAARASEQGPPSGKTDKWFNLETPLAASATVPASSLDAYRALSASPAPRPLAIQVLLAVPPPGGGTALVHTPSRTRVDPAPRFVLLEEWVLAFAAPASSSASAHSAASTSTSTSRSSSTDDGGDVAPPTIYKNAIPLFRALFALLRVLPAWRAVRKLAGRRAANGGRLRVVLRVADAEGGQGWGGDPTLEFGDSPAPGVGAEPLPTSTHVFPPILHPAGTLTLSATYLTTPAFTLESLEALLSSRFAVLDADAAPTRYDEDAQAHRRYASDTRARYSSDAPGPVRARQRSHDEDDDDAGFVPTLARRPAAGSSSTASAVGTGLPPSSPGRYTTPLPPSPGRYTTPLPASPGRYTTPLPPSPSRHTAPLPTPGSSASSGRYTSAFQACPRAESQASGSASAVRDSPAPSYRMGVHVAAGSGYRRDVAAGADVADRFVLPRSGASSVSVSLSGAAARGSPMGGEYAASEREQEREREKGVPIGGVGGAGASGGSSAIGGGVVGGSGGGPSVIAINPFKSHTLSRGSLSGSLLRGVAGSPASLGSAGAGRPTSPIAAGAPSPIGSAGGVAFPPTGESGSVGGSGGGGGPPGAVGIPMRKRYSSSFPHRYGSVGSGGSGDSGSASGSVLPPRERTSSGSRSGSFLKGAPAAADAQHDDIASYVQDIDAARPLLGRYRLEQQQGEAPVAAAASRLDEDRPGSRQSEGGSSSPGTSRGGTVRGSSTAAARTVTLDAHAGSGSGGAMLTSESEVDERLRRMNEEFARSLVGLGRRGSH